MCAACAHVTERPNAVIEHPPGEETQFDWLELPDPPAHWGFPTKKAFLLVGSLAHSGVWRAVLSPSMDLPHLLAAMTTVLGLLGGLTRDWRFDRMRTVLDPATDDLTPMFAAFAKHHAVTVIACRPRSGNRKGVVEKNNHTAAQRWWRTVPDELTAEQAQAAVEAFAKGQDQRRREDLEGTTTAAAMFAAERLRPLPVTVFPVVVTRDTGHVTALETVAMASAPPGRPHRRKERIPPGPAARRAAQVLTGTQQPSTVISLAAYEQAAKNRNTLR